MDCPRCGRLNPPEAQRCDCGYDFLKGLKTALGAILLLNVCAGMWKRATGDPGRMLVVISWASLMWVLYALVVRKHYWAYVVLIVITLPIGLVLAFMARDVRLYCLQK
jgi:hypothetical protein